MIRALALSFLLAVTSCTKEDFGVSANSLLGDAARIESILAGKGLYVGVGVGLTISDDLPDTVSDPFWAARIGWEFHILPKLTLDINANYRAGSFSELDEADSDAITLGAIVRF